MSAEKTLPSYSKRSPRRMPRRISTESRIVASGFVTFGGPPCLVLLRKILDVPKPAMKRPGPAASCTSRASMATCTGWRVYGEMIPQPTVSRFVSRAMMPASTVEDLASMPCLRHHG